MKIIFALLFLAGTIARAETLYYGSQLIDDPGYNFNSFGNQYNTYVGGVTRGANLGGTNTVSWYGISMSHVSGDNGISWTGNNASSLSYAYGNSVAGTGADADSLTNSGIHGQVVGGVPTTTITISSMAGYRYVVDLLFANAFTSRNFDVSVGGLLYADNLNLTFNGTDFKRPLVYRLEYVATGSSIPIAFTDGADAGDKNPFVNAVMVTQVPEPSAGALLVVGMAVWAVIRRRK